jgi:phosphoserine phosphatase
MSIIPRPVFEDLLQKHVPPDSQDPPLCVFDCDGTLIQGDIGEAMLFHQLEHSLFRQSPGRIWTDHPQRTLLDSLFTEMGDRMRDGTPAPDPRFADMILSWYFDQLREHETVKACVDIVTLFAGYSVQEVQEIARRTLNEELSTKQGSRTLGSHTLNRGIRFIAESMELLKAIQDRGCDVWVVSGSNRWSVEAVCSDLGISSDHIIGIELHEMNGVLTQQVKNPVPVLEGKVEILKEKVSREPVLVVSDSVYDVPLFRYSRGGKVLVSSGVASSSEFFSRAHVVRDASWFVIEHPTLV